MPLSTIRDKKNMATFCGKLNQHRQKRMKHLRGLNLQKKDIFSSFVDNLHYLNILLFIGLDLFICVF